MLVHHSVYLANETSSDANAFRLAIASDALYTTYVIFELCSPPLAKKRNLSWPVEFLDFEIWKIMGFYPSSSEGIFRIRYSALHGTESLPALCFTAASVRERTWSLS